MIDVSCKLLSTIITTDSIGIEKEITTEKEIPIIKVESVYSNEFYKANEQGFKPNLRLKISTLNYDNESELIYKGITYTIIRVEEDYDETILICQRKVKNVKYNKTPTSI